MSQMAILLGVSFVLWDESNISKCGLQLENIDLTSIFYKEEKWEKKHTTSMRKGTSKDVKYYIHIVKKLSGPYGGW